ncbi:hypothetical protein Y1Q_0013411 [Alligator mississippiensis]|uniref:Transmembrane protein 272 n=1 Tax=Alligator mississippiensis TaxID=8496 RepID=A0A151MCN3_ALLMI|nr:hypothetical protein Y1Q_0013411 [Alligator mississippiensis]
MAADPEDSSVPLLRDPEDSPVTLALTCLGKLVLSALPVACVAVGAVYLRQCPCQPLVPVYLLGMGVVALLSLMLTCLPCGDGAEPPPVKPGVWGCHALFLLFLFAWFIAGNVWVYSIYPPEYVAIGNPHFCHRGLYLFAFWLTTGAYIALGLALLLALGATACLLLLRTRLPWARHADYP